MEDDPQGPQDLSRAERLLPALVAARVAALLLLKQMQATVKDAGFKLCHSRNLRMIFKIGPLPTTLFGQENKA